MSDHTIEVRAATNSDLDRVDALLDASGLPRLDERAEAAVLVATVDGEVIGAGGVERYGSVGLLRSVVVANGHRGRGHGTTLCDRLEARSRERGVATLYLLTTTAPAFFADRGYVESDRADAPPAIQETTEFDDRCPTSATCMRKSL